MTSSCCAPGRGDDGAHHAVRADPITPDTLPDVPRVTPRAEPLTRGLLTLPGGRFAMGYDGPLANPGEGEGPVREALVDPFSISATPVTNQQFATFVKQTGYRTDAEAAGWSFVFHLLLAPGTPTRGRVAGAEWWIAVDGADWRHPGGPGSDVHARPQHPVVHVSWRDAQAYCSWAGVRLPTETEWEYAARGGLDGAIYPWGDEHPQTARSPRCNIWEGVFPTEHAGGPEAVGTVPVKSFQPNGFGLYQSVGNVWEWTATPWHPPSSLPMADSDQRVRRGGSYLCHDSYCNRYRVAARDHSGLDDSTGNLGFRVAF